MEHTPGKWKAILSETNGHGGFSIVSEGDGSTVATVYASHVWSKHGIGDAAKDPLNESSVADAFLVAASPRMFEALVAIHNAIVKGDLIWKHKRQADSDPYHPANTLMTAAISEAKGLEE